jgi:hypothetical protein
MQLTSGFGAKTVGSGAIVGAQTRMGSLGREFWTFWGGWEGSREGTAPEEIFKMLAMDTKFLGLSPKGPK